DTVFAIWLFGSAGASTWAWFPQLRIQRSISSKFPKVKESSIQPFRSCLISRDGCHCRSCTNGAANVPNEMRIVCFVLVGLAKTDVALDRLRTDFQFLRKFSAIRITARF